MWKSARIIGVVTRPNELGQRVAIPEGECEVDKGPLGIGPYKIRWREGENLLEAEFTLQEFARYSRKRWRKSRNFGCA